MGGYAVIYDVWNDDQQEWIECFYEAFDTVKQAENTFLDMCFQREEYYRNPRVVIIHKAIDPPDDTKWDFETA